MIAEASKKEKRVEMKDSVADLVTETDQKVERMIISTLKDKFPSHWSASSSRFCLKSLLSFFCRVLITSMCILACASPSDAFRYLISASLGRSLWLQVQNVF